MDPQTVSLQWSLVDWDTVSIIRVTSEIVEVASTNFLTLRSMRLMATVEIE